jgi:hypothetical protein
LALRRTSPAAGARITAIFRIVLSAPAAISTSAATPQIHPLANEFLIIYPRPPKSINGKKLWMRNLMQGLRWIHTETFADFRPDTPLEFGGNPTHLAGVCRPSRAIP